MAFQLIPVLTRLKALKVIGPVVGPEAVKLAKRVIGARALRNAAHDLAWQRNGLVGEVRFLDGAKRWVVVTSDFEPIAAFPPYKDNKDAQLREGLTGVDFSRCVGPSKKQIEQEKRQQKQAAAADETRGSGVARSRSSLSSLRSSTRSSSGSRKR